MNGKFPSHPWTVGNGTTSMSWSSWGYICSFHTTLRGWTALHFVNVDSQKSYTDDTYCWVVKLRSTINTSSYVAYKADTKFTSISKSGSITPFLVKRASVVEQEHASCFAQLGKRNGTLYEVTQKLVSRSLAYFQYYPFWLLPVASIHHPRKRNFVSHVAEHWQSRWLSQLKTFTSVICSSVQLPKLLETGF